MIYDKLYYPGLFKKDWNILTICVKSSNGFF